MRTLFTSAMVVVLAATAPGLVVQTARGAQEKPAQKVQKPPREVGKPQTKAEYDAYVAITQAPDPQQRTQLCEKYLQDFPDSGLTPMVHQIAATTYQQLNNFDKLAEHGEATLVELPDNPVVLTMLVSGYAERAKPDLALERAEKAVTVINNFQAPAGMDPAQLASAKKDLLATVYGSMGAAYLTKGSEEHSKRPPADPNAPAGEKKEEADPNLESAITYLNKALELSPKDDYSYYRLGIVYTLKNDADKAIDAYAKAVAISGAVAPMAKENLEKVYKITHKDSLDGLNEQIQKAKDALGSQGGASTAPAQPPGK